MFILRIRYLFLMLFFCNSELVSFLHYMLSCHIVGSDAILLGAETFRGLYPVECISIVGKICAEVIMHSLKMQLVLFSPFKEENVRGTTLWLYFCIMAWSLF